MIDKRSNLVTEFWRTSNINAGLNFVVLPGQVTNAPSVANGRLLSYLKFGLYADQIITLDVEESFDAVTYRIATSVSSVASTWCDTYNLPAPRNSTGWYVINWPYVRLRLTNPGAVNTTVLTFYAQISSGM